MRSRLTGTASTIAVLALASLALTVPAPAALAQQADYVTPSDPAALAQARAMGATAKQLETALLAHYDAKRAWPASIGALVAFAKAEGHAIDIGVFAAIALEVAPGGQSVLVTFQGGPAYPSEGAFAVSRRTVN